jgi:hypothetical protein
MDELRFTVSIAYLDADLSCLRWLVLPKMYNDSTSSVIDLREPTVLSPHPSSRTSDCAFRKLEIFDAGAGLPKQQENDVSSLLLIRPQGLVKVFSHRLQGLPRFESLFHHGGLGAHTVDGRA